MISFNQALYLWRKERKLTQEGLARLSGISRPNLSIMEQGGKDVTLATLRRLAQALRIRPGILADGIPPGEVSKKRLSRESLDRIARSLRGEPIKLSHDEEKLASRLEILMKQKLHLTARYGRSLPRTARQEKEAWLRIRSEYGMDQLMNLLSRVNKLSR